jgi:probable HAF family extracellular repeat protein
MSYAYGISADGSVVAGIGSGQSSIQAYRWTAATGAVPLGYLPGGNHSTSQEISADGLVIVGTSGSTAAGILSEAMRWTSDSGMVALGDLPGGFFDSWAADTSADGSVVVGSSRAGAGYEAFRWTEDTDMVSLGDLSGGAHESVANAVSADGSVIVGYGNSSIGREAMVWTATRGTSSLRDLLLAHGVTSVANWQLTEAYDVSADGLRIVGTGINPDGNYEAWIAGIPEPTSVTLVAVALLGMIWMCRLRVAAK